MSQKHDLYGVSDIAVSELVSRIAMGGTFFDCCSSKGEISYALRRHFPKDAIITNDINHELPATHHFDAKRPENWSRFHNTKDTPDWIVSNPPFAKAFPILVNAYDTTRTGIAFLLRLSFIEPTYERQDWLDENPPTQLIVLPRYSFTEDGKIDSITTAWFIWDKRYPWKQPHIHVVKKSKL